MHPATDGSTSLAGHLDDSNRTFRAYPAADVAAAAVLPRRVGIFASTWTMDGSSLRGRPVEVAGNPCLPRCIETGTLSDATSSFWKRVLSRMTSPYSQSSVATGVLAAK